MATVNNWVVDNVPFNITATYGTVTRSSATQCKVVINASWTSTGTMWGVQVTSGGGTANIPSFDGKVRKSGSGQLTGTYTVSKNVAGTIDVTVTFKIYDDTGKSATKSLTLKSVSVPAWTSYKVAYNANGGTGAPSAQTKWKDQTLVLSSTKPTRTGHSFNKWNTAAGGTGTSYSPGGNYTANADVTLYAQWKADTYPVTFNANGGAGAPSPQTKTYGQTLKLSSTKPTRTNYNFLGWATSASATTATYAGGGSYTANAAVTLYAVWELAYVKPRITNLSVVRCNYVKLYFPVTYNEETSEYVVDLIVDSIECETLTNNIVSATLVENVSTTDGYGVYLAETSSGDSVYVCERYTNVIADDGTFALVTFDWKCDREITHIGIFCDSGSDYPDEYQSTLDFDLPTGTSGTFNERIGYTVGEDPNVYGPFSVDSTYTFRVRVEDSIGYYERVVVLNGLVFPIDFLAGGEGAAFGKPAELGADESLGGSGVAEFAFDAKFNEPVYGKALGMDRLPSIPSNSDLNDYMETGCYAVHQNTVAATIKNIPVGIAGRLEVWASTGSGIQAASWSYLRQRYIPFHLDEAVFERDIERDSTNTWRYGDWHRTSLSPTVSDKVYHQQKLLWGGNQTGGMYMTSGHTANLTEAVSAQPNGIILVFCAYESDTDTNYGWETFFVPKQLVALSTSGHTFVLGRGKFTRVGTKYLYIYDTYITGHDDNNLTGTSNGITYANNKFVLRYVIGV